MKVSTSRESDVDVDHSENENSEDNDGKNSKFSDLNWEKGSILKEERKQA